MDGEKQENQKSEKRGVLPIMKRVDDDQLPGFRMTQRDVEILKAVYTHGPLTAKQIMALLFPQDSGQRHRTESSRARHRLKMLYQKGFLDRDEQPGKESEGRKPLIYLIDKLAIPILASEYGVSRKNIKWRSRDNKLSWRHLEHHLSMNDVRIAIELAAKDHGYTIVRWLDEKTLKSREMKDWVEIKSQKGRVARATIVPDGYFFLTDGEYDYHHLLEVDMGTVTGISDKFNRRTFARKIQGYQAYYASGKYKTKYETDSIRVLTVTTGHRRKNNLKKIAERLKGGELFWFTTFEQATPETVLTEPIWSVAGQQKYRQLIW